MENLKPNEVVEQLLETIKDTEREVIKLFYGIKDGSEHSLEDIASILNLSVEEVNETHTRAIRMLKHPSRSHTISNDEFYSAVSSYKGYKELVETIINKK